MQINLQIWRWKVWEKQRRVFAQALLERWHVLRHLRGLRLPVPNWFRRAKLRAGKNITHHSFQPLTLRSWLIFRTWTSAAQTLAETAQPARTWLAGTSAIANQEVPSAPTLVLQRPVKMVARAMKRSMASTVLAHLAFWESRVRWPHARWSRVSTAASAKRTVVIAQCVIRVSSAKKLSPATMDSARTELSAMTRWVVGSGKYNTKRDIAMLRVIILFFCQYKHYFTCKKKKITTTPFSLARKGTFLVLGREHAISKYRSYVECKNYNFIPAVWRIWMLMCGWLWRSNLQPKHQRLPFDALPEWCHLWGRRCNLHLSLCPRIHRCFV